MAKTGHPNIVFTHIRYRRGKPHKWQTVLNFSGATPDATTLANLMAYYKTVIGNIMPPAASPISTPRGFLTGAAYTGQGGGPILHIPYGTEGDESTWGGYTGTAWTQLTNQQDSTVAETCFTLAAPLQGLSTRGKLVYLRHYFHGPWIMPALGEKVPDISQTNVTSLQNEMAKLTSGGAPDGRVLVSPSGRQVSGPWVCNPFFVTRQMTRGRRRKPKPVTVRTGSGQTVNVAPVDTGPLSIENAPQTPNFLVLP